MKEAAKKRPAKEFRVPEGIVFARIDRSSGLLANSASSDTFFQSFLAGTEPTKSIDRSQTTSGGDVLRLDSFLEDNPYSRLPDLVSLRSHKQFNLACQAQFQEKATRFLLNATLLSAVHARFQLPHEFRQAWIPTLIAGVIPLCLSIHIALLRESNWHSFLHFLM